jgi:hypothetical protein
MRRELWQQFVEKILAPTRSPVRITLRDIEESIRKITPDPMLAERRVGALYGQVFRRKERFHDYASEGRCVACGRDIYECLDSPCDGKLPEEIR